MSFASNSLRCGLTGDGHGDGWKHFGRGFGIAIIALIQFRTRGPRGVASRVDYAAAKINDFTMARYIRMEGDEAMTEMVDRVASALMRVETEDKISDYYKLARAAIDAMREPTEAMMLAGERAMDAESVDSKAYTGWRAIGAALGLPQS